MNEAKLELAIEQFCKEMDKMKAAILASDEKPKGTCGECEYSLSGCGRDPDEVICGHGTQMAAIWRSTKKSTKACKHFEKRVEPVKPKYRDIPIVGFRYADGVIRPTPTWVDDQVLRATHVVVEE